MHARVSLRFWLLFPVSHVLTTPGLLHFPHPPCWRPILSSSVEFVLILLSCRCVGAGLPPRRRHPATPTVNSLLRPELRVNIAPASALFVRTALHLPSNISGDAAAVAELRAQKSIPPGPAPWVYPALDCGAHTRHGGGWEGKGGDARFKDGPALGISLVAESQ